ncbi:MAG: TetR/AcrR family transcriptional regulator [Propionibacteriaceae bacterium]|jgi:AcrR family transcriptional regulator|nr:TetR/AcrR family transcriptional regulator [Propionibacteriaceae bacterium]
MTQHFQRARNEKQRASRREAILAAAAALLDQVPVSELTLTELAKRAGLAKSNVLRYFESREGVLLELYDREYQAWLDQLSDQLQTATDIEAVAATVAATVADRPRLCQLAANVSALVEHNPSGEAAAAYKKSALANASRLAELIGARLGGYSVEATVALVGAVNLGIGGLWSATRPSPGMALAYETHPELPQLRHDLGIALHEYVATILTGLAHREPRFPFVGSLGPLPTWSRTDPA